MCCLRINRAVDNKHLAVGMTGLFGLLTLSDKVSLWVWKIEEEGLAAVLCVCVCMGRGGGGVSHQ